MGESCSKCPNNFDEECQHVLQLSVCSKRGIGNSFPSASFALRISLTNSAHNALKNHLLTAVILRWADTRGYVAATCYSEKKLV